MSVIQTTTYKCDGCGIECHGKRDSILQFWGYFTIRAVRNHTSDEDTGSVMRHLCDKCWTHFAGELNKG